jgi:lipoprotein NlpI
MEATGLARTAPELESTALRPSVENLLILRKLRRANEAFLHGDYDAAASDFQRVLEIDPLNQKAVDMLKKITLTGHSQ